MPLEVVLFPLSVAKWHAKPEVQIASSRGSQPTISLESRRLLPGSLDALSASLRGLVPSLSTAGGPPLSLPLSCPATTPQSNGSSRSCQIATQSNEVPPLWPPPLHVQALPPPES